MASTAKKTSSAKMAATADKLSTRARPKTGSRSTRQSTASAKKPADAIALLKADHKEVDAMFKAYEKTDDDEKKQKLANNICMALTVHAQIEEEIFYPAAYVALDEDGDDLLDEAEVEHATCKALIAEIEMMSVGELLFDAKTGIDGRLTATIWH